MAESLDWTGGSPRSRRFGDIYFSLDDGLAESRAVFLGGCDLPLAWSGRSRFVVGELGFGTGLNILALIELWRTSRPSPSATLHIFSIEGFLIGRDDAARSLAAWPELASLAETLLEAWPSGRPGFHRIEWPDLGVVLDLATLEAETALQAWSGSADAWFLDGFSPACNPQMWRPDVLALLAARSRSGTRLATFTVAGVVRRGLQAVGFDVWRAPGFGRKSARLEGRLIRPDPAAPASLNGSLRAAVIGGGIAGVSLVRALGRLGLKATLFEADGLGAGASGNPAALVTPRLDAGLGPGAELHAQAFSRAIALYRRETPEALLAVGSLQLETDPRDGRRYERIAEWEGFDAASLARVTSAEAAAALGEDLAAAGLRFNDALVIEPSRVLAVWAPVSIEARIDRLERIDGAWRLLDAAGGTVMEADLVCLAGGPAAVRLVPSLPLRPVRGQVTVCEGAWLPGPAAVWGGWAMSTRDGVLYGATHDRDDPSTEPRASDDARNLALLEEGRPRLAQALQGRPVHGRASLRAMTSDHSPLAGAVSGAPGLVVLSGLGGRGFTLAPLLAETVAASAVGAPSPLPRRLEALVDPARFVSPRRGRRSTVEREGDSQPA